MGDFAVQAATWVEVEGNRSVGSGVGFWELDSGCWKLEAGRRRLEGGGHDRRRHAKDSGWRKATCDLWLVTCDF